MRIAQAMLRDDIVCGLGTTFGGRRSGSEDRRATRPETGDRRDRPHISGKNQRRERFGGASHSRKEDAQ
ncbi:hypothetical protein SCP_0302980 [Sparassis crispa]|uniref:Uncharacterized protein n=1 Tax=Sparassis crispa TaxID=139825 RepID=A0A401GEQ6_9APHY|nr:hypothetical protein SCP_0302980 [Sparassis crispa]GBE80583.1 hypothetical protein SCP_0302980 [Sparassis crispa]